jgi:N-acetylmuramoyl-L-alanine amidase CwlA
VKIIDHKLQPGWRKPSPNHGGPLDGPTLLVMHYTVSGAGAKGVADYFTSPAANASAHIVVGRDGDIRQVVPFNVKAWHAGKSVWRGRSNCNDYSIGIEIDIEQATGAEAPAWPASSAAAPAARASAAWAASRARRDATKAWAFMRRSPRFLVRLRA